MEKIFMSLKDVGNKIRFINLRRQMSNEIYDEWGENNIIKIWLSGLYWIKKQ